MIEFNQELQSAMNQFKSVFGDIVPLRQISTAVTNEQLISAIHESIMEGVNLLPLRFGYTNDADKTY